MLDYIKRDIYSFGNELDFWKKYINAFISVGFEPYDRNGDIILNYEEYLSNEFLVDSEHTAQSRLPWIKLIYNDYFPIIIRRSLNLYYRRGKSYYNIYGTFSANLIGTTKTYNYPTSYGLATSNANDTSSYSPSNYGSTMLVYIPQEFVNSSNNIRGNKVIYTLYQSASDDIYYNTNNIYQEAHLVFIKDSNNKFLNIMFGDQYFTFSTLNEYYTNIMFIETDSGKKIIGGTHNFDIYHLDSDIGTSYSEDFRYYYYSTEHNYYYSSFDNSNRCGFWEIGNDTVRNIRIYVPTRYTLNNFSKIDIKKGAKLVIKGDTGLSGTLKPYDTVSLFYVCSNVEKGRLITIEGKNYFSISNNLLLPYGFDDNV